VALLVINSAHFYSCQRLKQRHLQTLLLSKHDNRGISIQTQTSSFKHPSHKKPLHHHLMDVSRSHVPAWQCMWGCRSRHDFPRESVGTRRKKQPI